VGVLEEESLTTGDEREIAKSPFSLGRVRSVLALGAHADDIEIGAGGTLLRLAADAEVVIHWVVLSAVGARAAEALRSASLYLDGRTSTVEILAFRERYFSYLPELKEYFDELGARLQPDLILAPRTDDMHQDHRIAGELAVNTFRSQPILQYEIVKYEGDLLTPNIYVPLPAEKLDEKIRFLQEAYPSQHVRYWWRPETFRGIAAVRGAECRSESGFAEGFHCRKLVMG
jgi:LmbE family N-acetylglucosaminyl deacetylase